MAEDVAATVAALEDARYAAMLACDTEALDRLLDERLRYVHSSGRVDEKASYLGGFGRLWRHRAIERKEQTIVPLGETVLVFSTQHIEVRLGDGLRKSDARTLAVWTESGGTWRVVAVFSAPLPTITP